MAIVFLQGMMGTPFVLLFWFGMLVIVFSVIILAINFFRSESKTELPKQISYYWALVLAFIGTAWIVYKLWTFEGPWIN